MNSQGPLLTPSTYAGSDFGITPSGGALHRKWSASSSIKHRAQRKNAEQSSIVGSIEVSVVSQTKRSTAKPRHVFKRAIHKIGKRFRQRSDQVKKPVVEAPPPPKIEDLGIDPRLLKKWMSRKELQKQLAAAGEVKPNSRGAAALIAIGLSKGSVSWVKDRLCRWKAANGVVLAACIVALAVGLACMVIVRRCS